jgi:hypothetical protein
MRRYVGWEEREEGHSLAVAWITSGLGMNRRFGVFLVMGHPSLGKVSVLFVTCFTDRDLNMTSGFLFRTSSLKRRISKGQTSSKPFCDHLWVVLRYPQYIILRLRAQISMHLDTLILAQGSSFWFTATDVKAVIGLSAGPCLCY